MGPDMLARAEVYVPASLPQQLSGGRNFEHLKTAVDEVALAVQRLAQRLGCLLDETPHVFIDSLEGVGGDCGEVFDNCHFSIAGNLVWKAFRMAITVIMTCIAK